MPYTNPILEEVWRIKEDLAAEAGHDVAKLADETHRWAQAHGYNNPVVRDAEELRELYAARASYAPSTPPTN